MITKRSCLLFASVFLLATTLVAISQAPSHQEPSKKDVEKAVLARLNDVQKAAQSLDAEKVFSIVMENDKGALIQNGRYFQTRAQALESVKRGFQGLKKVDYQFNRQEVSMLSSTIALVTGEGVSHATTKDGTTLTTAFAQSVILVLTNGEWRVFHSHRSFPPAKQ